MKELYVVSIGTHYYPNKGMWDTEKIFYDLEEAKGYLEKRLSQKDDWDYYIVSEYDWYQIDVINSDLTIKRGMVFGDVGIYREKGGFYNDEDS